MKTKAEDIEIPIPMAAEEPEQVREPEEAFEAEEPAPAFLLQ